jgi:hypothetical protein
MERNGTILPFYKKTYKNKIVTGLVDTVVKAVTCSK